jgi:pimeloyl-ACP methyl ester carboxylesterase
MHIETQIRYAEPASQKSLDREPLCLHQRSSPSNNHDVIIFVHGLGGKRYGKASTWSNFPSLVYENFEPIDVGMYSYQTLLGRLFRPKSVDLQSEAAVLSDSLRLLPQYKGIVLVAHSMGGLLCQAAVVNMIERNDLDLLSKLRGMILLGVPQAGSLWISGLRSLMSHFSSDARALKAHGPLVTRIQDMFRLELCTDISVTEPNRVFVPIFAIRGSEDSWVDAFSAGLNLPSNQRRDIRATHTELSKPPTNSSPIFEQFSACLREILDATELKGGFRGYNGDPHLAGEWLTEWSYRQGRQRVVVQDKLQIKQSGYRITGQGKSYHISGPYAFAVAEYVLNGRFENNNLILGEFINLNSRGGFKGFVIGKLHPDGQSVRARWIATGRTEPGFGEWDWTRKTQIN